MKNFKETPVLMFIFLLTFRQFDLRESHICHSNEHCKNILIDLKIHVEACEVKCIEVNPCQSELLAIGCSDPYVRLYDRRMLAEHCTASGVTNCSIQTCDSSTASLPVGCAQYFTPGHLPCSTRRGKRRSVVSTYLTFSPNGHELLVNLGGEQLYLFDIRTQRSPLSYTTASFSVENTGATSRNGFVHYETSCDDEKAGSDALSRRKSCDTNRSKPSTTNGYTVAKEHKGNTSSTCGKSTQLCGKALDLKSLANTEYENRNFWGAINLYNQALVLAPNSAVLYANRAAAFLKRGW